ncbi:MAG: IS4 family transposase [Flavobacterium macrobrachii]|jgi:hypothetical protein
MTISNRKQVAKLFSLCKLAKNAARQKLIIEVLLALLECKKIQLNELSLHIDSKAKEVSTERRLQDFFAKFTFDYDLVALLLYSCLPKGKVTLCIDRTEWDFGKYQCNILIISAYFNGTSIPIYWELLDNKSGNSSSEARIDLLKKCVQLIGKNRILRIVGDREFIGKDWIGYLVRENIGFCFRVPQHHQILLKNGCLTTVKELLTSKAIRKFQQVIVDSNRCNLYIKKLKNDYLFLIGNEFSGDLGSIYRLRWSIEVLFQSCKQRGFNLEETHFKSSEKIKKLLVFVFLAFAICINTGILLHSKEKCINIKNHGYKANSYFRVGLNAWRRFIKNKAENLLLAYFARYCKIITHKLKNYKSSS